MAKADSGLARAALAVMLALPVAWPAHALEVVDRTTPYEIRGRSLEALRDALRAAKLSDEQGRPYHGLTTAAIAWEAEYTQHLRRPGQPARCEVAAHRVRVEIVTTLPQWRDHAAAPVVVRRRWDAYYAALERHERTHRQLALEGAQQIDALLGARPAGESCLRLQIDLDNRINGILLRSRIRNEAFDRRTNYGRSAGVVL